MTLNKRRTKQRRTNYKTKTNKRRRVNKGGTRIINREIIQTNKAGGVEGKDKKFRPKYIGDMDESAYFKYNIPLSEMQEWHVAVLGKGRDIFVGFASEKYDPTRSWFTHSYTTYLGLSDNSRIINDNISVDGRQYLKQGGVNSDIPKGPFTVGLRVDTNKVPQFKIIGDTRKDKHHDWEDFIPKRKLIDGPWYPCLEFGPTDIIENVVIIPKQAKSAGTRKTPLFEENYTNNSKFITEPCPPMHNMIDSNSNNEG